MPRPPRDRGTEPGKARRGGWARLLRTPTPLLFVGSVALAFLLLWRQGSLAQLGAALAGANGWTITVGVLLYAVGLVLLCLRWHMLVRMVGGGDDFPVAAEAFLTSVVLNYAAPIGLAVPARAALSTRDLRLTAAAGGAVAGWEVALDLVVLGAVGAGWLVMDGGRAVAGWRSEVPWWAVAVVVGGGTAVGGLGVLLGRRRGMGGKLGRAIGEGVRYPAQRPRWAAAAVLATVVFWVLQAVILRLLLDAVGVGGVGWGVVIGVMALPILLGMVSPVPGGAGVREALMVAVAQSRGLEGAAVLLAAVAYRVSLFAAIPVVFLAVRGWRAWRAAERRGRDRRATGG